MARQQQILPVDMSIRDRATNSLLDLLAGNSNNPVDRQTALRQAKAISGLIDYIPFLGDASAFSDANKSFSEGDAVGGSIDTLAGVVGLLPAAGDLAAKGIKSVKGSIQNIPKVTRDTPLVRDIRIGDLDKVNNLNVKYEGGTAPEYDLLRAEDIIDRPYVSTMADTSRGNLERVTSINGTPMNSVQHGGNDFMLHPYNLESDILWASDADKVKDMYKMGYMAQDLFKNKRNPIFMPYQMSAQSPDFSTMTTDVMVPYAQQNMSKSDKARLDKRIREGSGKVKGYSDWIGIDHPKAMEQLSQMGGNRKLVSKALDEFRDAGSLSMPETMAIITDPNQFDPRVGNLFNAGIMDMSRGILDQIHPTYSGTSAGEHVGTFINKPNLLRDMNPKTRFGIDFVGQMQDRGHDLNAAKLPAPVGKAMQSGLIGQFDQALVDELIAKGFVLP